MRKLTYVTIAFLLVMSVSLVGMPLDASARPLAAASDPGLGASANASIISTTGVTNAGSSSTSLDVDVSPGPSCVAPVGLTIGGTAHFCDAVAAAALAAASAARLNMAGQPLTSNQGPALDGLTLVSGVYDIGAGRLNGGVLILDGPGFYVFRASSDFISSGSISFINGARACDLFWRVDSLATINGSSFAGTIISGTGVHFGANVALDGRAFAVNGDVTLISDAITGPSCPPAVGPSNTPTNTPTETLTPGPSSTPTETPLPATQTAIAATGTVIAATQTAIAATETAVAGGVGGGKSRNKKGAVAGLGNTGGAPIRNEDFPWVLVIGAGLLVTGVGLFSVRAYRRSNLPKQ